MICSRLRNRSKILAWDGSGFWVIAKRLGRDRFHWPWDDASRPFPGITHEELALLLGGIDPREYLKDALPRIASDPPERVGELCCPAKWKQTRERAAGAAQPAASAA